MEQYILQDWGGGFFSVFPLIWQPASLMQKAQAPLTIVWLFLTAHSLIELDPGVGPGKVSRGLCLIELLTGNCCLTTQVPSLETSLWSKEWFLLVRHKASLQRGFLIVLSPTCILPLVILLVCVLLSPSVLTWGFDPFSPLCPAPSLAPRVLQPPHPFLCRSLTICSQAASLGKYGCSTSSVLSPEGTVPPAGEILDGVFLASLAYCIPISFSGIFLVKGKVSILSLSMAFPYLSLLQAKTLS